MFTKMECTLPLAGAEIVVYRAFNEEFFWRTSTNSAVTRSCTQAPTAVSGTCCKSPKLRRYWREKKKLMTGIGSVPHECSQEFQKLASETVVQQSFRRSCKHLTQIGGIQIKRTKLFLRPFARGGPSKCLEFRIRIGQPPFGLGLTPQIDHSQYEALARRERTKLDQ